MKLTFEEVYNDLNNRKIAMGAVKRFRRLIPRDEIKTIIDQAFFVCYRDWDPNHPSGQKFTSRLHMYCEFFCKNYLTKENKRVKTISISDRDNIISTDNIVDTKFYEIISDLSQPEQRMIEMKFFERKSLRKIAAEFNMSTETIRTRIKSIYKKIRKQNTF